MCVHGGRNVVTFYRLLSFVKRFLTSVGKPVPPIRYSGLRASTRETVAMFVVVFTVCAADFQKLLHNVSSLAGKERQFSVCNSVIFTNCSCNLSI